MKPDSGETARSIRGSATLIAPSAPPGGTSLRSLQLLFRSRLVLGQELPDSSAGTSRAIAAGVPSAPPGGTSLRSLQLLFRSRLVLGQELADSSAGTSRAIAAGVPSAPLGVPRCARCSFFSDHDWCSDKNWQTVQQAPASLWLRGHLAALAAASNSISACSPLLL
jgi:hypothetical protein